MGDRPSAYLKDGAKLQRRRKVQLQVEGEPHSECAVADEKNSYAVQHGTPTPPIPDT